MGAQFDCAKAPSGSTYITILVEKVFGWMKQDRRGQIKLRGLGRVDSQFQLAAAAHNLLRMSERRGAAPRLAQLTTE